MRYRAFVLAFVLFGASLLAQQPPYQNAPPAEAPYFRVRYEASDVPDELAFPVTYTIWVPPGVKTLRGVVVHQHGCGEGSCKSGQTGAFDLHWQALARKHDCALMSPTYEQPDQADCQRWCDPRRGSDSTFQRSLAELGTLSGHPEVATVPWALWGHSGGGHWVGGMAMLHPERTIAAWLRSGAPPLTAVEGKPKPYAITIESCQVPMMCNLGTKEGVTVKDGQFAAVWPGVEIFFNAMRAKGGLVGVAVEPNCSHECGNQRYLAIPWLDACLTARLPREHGDNLIPMPIQIAWLAPPYLGDPDIIAPVPAEKFTGIISTSSWLPNEAIAKAWVQYVTDSAVTDTTPPPSPVNLRVHGNKLSWEADADLESGLASFLIERDGQFLANVPEQGTNPFGRPIFQNLQYSDTPTLPLAQMHFTDSAAVAGQTHKYRVISLNTVGLKSP